MRRHDERGAVLVEAVISLPLFMLLVLAIIEFGFALRTVTTVSAASSDAARAVSIGGDDADTDRHTLEVLADSAGALDESVIDRVIIYSASGPDDPVPPACLIGPVDGLCNSYALADHTLDPSRFGCQPAENLDRYFCPFDRDTSQATASFVGVHVVATHELVTGMFGQSRTIQSTDVLRVEPRER